MTAIPLGPCLHMASSNLPGQRARHCPAVLSPKLAPGRTDCVAVPIRFCSRCGLPCRLHCWKRGALLPHLFTLTRLALAGYGKRFVLCGTFPGVAPAGRYPAPYVDGARTFLSRSLSTVAGAAVQPTDRQAMGAAGRAVKRRCRQAVVAAFSGRLSSSACRVVSVEWSVTPSTRSGRKCRWNAVTTSMVVASYCPLGSMP